MTQESRFVEHFDILSDAQKNAIQSALDTINEHKIRTVLVSMADASGASRVKAVAANRFEQAALDGVLYQSGVLSLDSAADFVAGTGYDFEILGKSFRLVPDCTSFFITPWSPGTAWVTGDPYFDDGTPAAGAPRLTLQNTVSLLSERHLEITWGWEFEFYTFRRQDGQFVPTTTDRQALHQYRHRQAEPLLNAVSYWLGEAGVEVTDVIHKYGPGQLEVNFTPMAGIHGVDRAYFFRLAVKEILAREGIVASFMTKPLNGRSASGCHLHQSLYDKHGRNIFGDPDDRDGLSAELKGWVAGQLRHAAALTALTTPTVNGFKRYVPNSFAPYNASWGLENRTAMVRIPLDRGENTRVENRLPGAETNPYVAAAGMIATGLLGLDEGSNALPEPSENAYAGCLAPLPESLDQALAALEADAPLRDLLGEPFIRLYTAVKRNELRRFRSFVTDWERDEYLELT